MQVQEIRLMFQRNWVFKIYNFKIGNLKLPYLLSAALISTGLFLIGALGAVLCGAPNDYFLAISPYLHLAGIFLVFYSFDWFIKRMINILGSLDDVFYADLDTYRDTIQKPADSIASRNIFMLGVGAIFMILNIIEVNASWSAQPPPILLANWINSPAQLYFRIFYTLMHGVIIPFLLGSGIIGLIGYIVLINELFKLPLKLKNYQKTSLVIEWTTGLVMWTLMALGFILTLARPIVFFKTAIQEILLSGGVQALIAFILAVLVGVFPLKSVYKAIVTAKKKELRDWNNLRVATSNSLKKLLTNAYSKTLDERGTLSSDSDEVYLDLKFDKKLERINKDIESVDKEIRRINEIPGLPIKWPSILRVGVGTFFSIAMPMLKDFLLLRL